MTIVSQLLLGVGLGLVAFSCHDTCPTGYVLKQNACVLAAPEVGNPQDGGDNGPTIDAGDADSGVTSSCADSTFGNVCMTHTDCGCDTGYCAGLPGQQGICSHSGCLQDAAVCPAGWGCMDLAAYQAGLSLCTPP